MSKIFVVDTNKTPLNPIHPGRARILLQEGKAAVWKRYPFTIILKDVLPNPQFAPRLKIDAGAKLTALALVNDSTSEVVWAAELEHRGFQIRDALRKRREHLTFAAKLEIGARSQEPGGKRKKQGARRSVFTNMRCSRRVAS